MDLGGAPTPEYPPLPRISPMKWKIYCHWEEDSEMERLLEWGLVLVSSPTALIQSCPQADTLYQTP